MNSKPSSLKSTILMLAALGIGGLAYFYYYSNATPTDTSVTASAGDAEVGTRVLALLNQIQTIDISTALFKDAAFNTLVDYSVEIPPVNVGRPNPFAPLPGSISVQQSAAARGSR